jgi:hypothetical protein
MGMGASGDCNWLDNAMVIAVLYEFCYYFKYRNCPPTCSRTAKTSRLKEGFTAVLTKRMPVSKCEGRIAKRKPSGQQRGLFRFCQRRMRPAPTPPLQLEQNLGRWRMGRIPPGRRARDWIAIMAVLGYLRQECGLPKTIRNGRKCATTYSPSGHRRYLFCARKFPVLGSTHNAHGLPPPHIPCIYPWTWQKKGKGFSGMMMY